MTLTLTLPADTSAWRALRPKLEADIAERGVPRGEFVVSRMTKSVANCISEATSQPLPNAPALDIGTGTGYHSAMLLSWGIPVFARWTSIPKPSITQQTA